MSDPLFLEVAIGSVSNRGKAIPLRELGKTIAKNIGVEIFHSYYAFDSHLVDHFDLRNTIKGFVGKYHLTDNKYDIDGSTLDESLVNTQLFVSQLIQGFEIPRRWIQVWFSGSKGFHVRTPELFGFEPSETLYEDWKETVRQFSSVVDLSCLSYSGLWRAPWSLNAKSGGYKVPLRISELQSLSVDQIVDISRDPRKHRKGFVLKAWDHEEITPLLPSEKKKVPKRSVVAIGKKGIHSNMEHYVGCMQKLYRRGPVEGRRHQDALRLASSWRRRGLTLEQTRELMASWFDQQLGPKKDAVKDYEQRKIVQDVYERGYAYSCSDPVMTEFCVGESCLFFKGKNFVNTVDGMDDAIGRMVWNLSQNQHAGFDLAQVYGSDVTYRFRPGEVCVLYGDTKLGKTSLFQNWAVALGKYGYQVLNMSFEMEPDLLAERYCQIKHGLRVDDQKDLHEIREMIMTAKMSPTDLQEGLEHIRIMTSSPRVDEIDKILADNTPDIVIIDPLEDIQVTGGGYNPVKDQMEVIRQLKDISSRRKCIMLIVHHISKSSAREGDLHKHSGKGSSAIAQKADHLLAFEEQTPGSYYRRLRRLAGRRPQELSLTLLGDSSTYQFELATNNKSTLKLHDATNT